MPRYVYVSIDAYVCAFVMSMCVPTAPLYQFAYVVSVFV